MLESAMALLLYTGTTSATCVHDDHAAGIGRTVGKECLSGRDIANLGDLADRNARKRRHRSSRGRIDVDDGFRTTANHGAATRAQKLGTEPKHEIVGRVARD